MSIIKYISIFAVFLLSIAPVSFAQKPKVPSTQASSKKVEAYLEKLEKIGYSGSALIALNGQPVISKGYGYSDIERRIKNSPETIFDIGSITKQFTAAA